MKKIVYIVTEDWYFWSHRLMLAEKALAEGYVVTVLTNEGEFAERIRQRGIKLLSLNLPRGFASLQRELSAIITIIQHFKNIKPDIVHNIALKPVITGSIAGMLCGVPRIINAYTGLGFLFINQSVKTGVARSIALMVLKILSSSKRVYSIIQNHDDEKLLLEKGVIRSDRTEIIRGSGVDTGVFQYSLEEVTGKEIVLFASRLLRDKGIYEFIDAARLLKDNYPAARFVLAGDRDPGNPTSISTNELEAWIDEKLVEWWGYCDEMNTVLSSACIVCLPSYREGLPKVLVEAAACGRSVVTTDVPGCRDVVVDNVTGLLVEATDPAQLAAAIARLLDSPEKRKAMGKAGRKHVCELFSIDKINLATLNMYNALVSDAYEKAE